jgi:hypothetical protein
MKTPALKILSAASTLIVFFPNNSGAIFPFGFVLGGFENFSDLGHLLVTAVVWVSLTYIIYTATKRIPTKTENALTLLPLSSFLIFLLSRAADFIAHANWLSILTGLLATILTSTTIWKITKELVGDRKATI